jgi:hypothetical protein
MPQTDAPQHTRRMIGPADLIGPWSQTVPIAERRARFRSLKAVAGCMLGWRHPLTERLAGAETDPMAAVNALAILENLPARTRRHLWAAYLAAQPNEPPWQE